jgi:hypothetical protein
MPYGASPIKRRRRRSAVEIDDIKTAMYDVVEAEHPMSVRQVFYRLVSLGTIDKTESEYKTTVCRLLADMRRDGDLPFTWIADSTRWMRKPKTFPSLEEAARQTARFYRRQLWDEQQAYVEVWLEKDALAGVLYETTSDYDVPLMVTRGYPSLSFLYSAARGIAEQNKPAYLFYLGDHDPSGVDIPRKVESDLRQMAPKAEIHFARTAVNEDQISAWRLPTRPTKRTDSRAKTFRGESVEVDAIPPERLRQLVEEEILGLVDLDKMAATIEAEKSERQLVEGWAALIGQANR